MFAHLLISCEVFLLAVQEVFEKWRCFPDNKCGAGGQGSSKTVVAPATE